MRGKFVSGQNQTIPCGKTNRGTIDSETIGSLFPVVREVQPAKVPVGCRASQDASR